MLEKWKHAVVHLECATDSEHFYDRIKRIDEMRALLEQEKLHMSSSPKSYRVVLGISDSMELPCSSPMPDAVIS